VLSLSLIFDDERQLWPSGYF